MSPQARCIAWIPINILERNYNLKHTIKPIIIIIYYLYLLRIKKQLKNNLYFNNNKHYLHLKMLIECNGNFNYTSFQLYYFDHIYLINKRFV